MFVYNDQGGSYSPGWREIWTSTSDGSGSGLDADLLDGQQGSYYYPASNPNGYTNDQTAAEILTAIKTVDGSGSGLDADLLDGQQGSYYYPASNPNGYTNDQTAAEILTAIKTVDGSGSGLDADLLDGLELHTGRNNVANKVVRTDGNGYIQSGWINTTSGQTSNTITKIYGSYAGDDYLRWFAPSTIISQQGIWTSSNDGSGSGLDADLLDGQHGSYYYAASNPNGYTSNVGDITGVTAGTGLTGGGTSGTPTLNVIGGSGITANANDIAVDSTVVRTTGTQIIGGAKYFNNILAVTGADTAGYPLQQMTSPSVSTYGRIEFGYTGQTSRGRLQYNNTGDSMAFYTATAERARVTSAGDILVNKTASNSTVTGCELKANGIIYSTIEIPALSGGIQIRNNALTDSLTALRCYNGLADITTTSTTGGGHSLSISGGQSGEYARFTNAKRLGIGTTAPVQALHVVGSIVATGNITAYYSDERLKDLKGTIPNALDKVNQLNGYYYTPNETAQSLGVDNKGIEVGISAQEVEAVLPEIVTKSAIGDDYKTVWYEKLTPLLIEAVKELTEKVDKLEARLTELEK